jgi:hypothetical protein
MRAGQRGGVQQDAAGARKAHGLVSFRGRQGRRPRPAAAGCGRAAAPAAHRRPPSRASHAARRCRLPAPAAGRQQEVGVGLAGVEQQQQRRSRPPGAGNGGAEDARHAVAPVAGVQWLARAAPPGQVRAPAGVGQAVVPAGSQGQAAPANGTDMGDEAQQVMVGLRPVQPGDLVVLAVGVVVAALAVAHFAARGQHGRALAQQHGGQQGALQAGPA